MLLLINKYLLYTILKSLLRQKPTPRITPSEYKLDNKIKKKLYFIVFYFYKFIKAEFNYFIYDKEFFIIINIFKKFKYYFIKNMH